MESKGKKARFAREILNGMTDLGLEYAITHDVYKLFGDKTLTDVDIFTALKPAKVAKELLNDERVKFRLIMVNPYSYGSLSTFWMNSSGSAVQLDITSDRFGLGELGMRTSLAMEGIERTRNLFALSPFATEIYLFRKRYIKNAFPEALLHLRKSESLADNSAKFKEVLSLRARLQAWALTHLKKGPSLGNRLRQSYLMHVYTRILRTIRPIGCQVIFGKQSERLAFELQSLLEMSGIGVRLKEKQNNFVSYLSLFSPTAIVSIVAKPTRSIDTIETAFNHLESRAIKSLKFYEKFGW